MSLKAYQLPKQCTDANNAQKVLHRNYHSCNYFIFRYRSEFSTRKGPKSMHRFKLVCLHQCMYHEYMAYTSFSLSPTWLMTCCAAKAQKQSQTSCTGNKQSLITTNRWMSDKSLHKTKRKTMKASAGSVPNEHVNSSNRPFSQQPFWHG